MQMDYDVCRENLEELAQYYSDTGIADRNEATTRLHLIDQLFFECLGWMRDDCIPEERFAGDYADYVFSTIGKTLIVEAKRGGDYFELPAGGIRIDRSLKPLSADYSNLNNALKQVASYCQARGVQVGAVCNGHQLVAFLATRSDGIPPLEGKAVVFDSFPTMLDNFLELWNCLSKDGMTEGYLVGKLREQTLTPLPPKLSASVSRYPGTKIRNVFQTDLRILSDLVLEDMVKEDEEAFLRECYCSSGALSEYSFLSRQILKSRYASLIEEDGPIQAVEPAVDKAGVISELIVESLGRRPLLLIGDIGVGKTTFIRHLIKIDAADIMDNVIALYLDLGSLAALSLNLKGHLIDEIREQLLNKYDIDIENRQFVRGVYHFDLRRFRAGIFGDLLEKEPDKFKEKELEKLTEFIEKRDRHLKLALEHIAKGRNKKIVIFIDNADQRDDETQQQAFLIAHEMADNWPVIVYVALRPETYHKSMRYGALSGYHPKVFTISPPRINEIIKKRLKFALKIASGETPVMHLGRKTGIRLQNLSSVIKAFQLSVARNDELIEAIDNIAAGNARKALDIIKEFFGSGHVDTKKIAQVFDEQGPYFIPLHEFLRAVIFGDNEYFDPNRSPICNMFDISTNDQKEHFLLPIMMGTIISLRKLAGEHGFVGTKQIYTALQAFGYLPDQIELSLERSIEKKLFEARWREDITGKGYLPYMIRLASLGAYHYYKLLSYFSYVDAMIVDTPILDAEVRKLNVKATDIIDRLDRTDSFRKYLDEQWARSELSSDVFNWTKTSAALGEHIAKIRTKVKAMRRS